MAKKMRKNHLTSQKKEVKMKRRRMVTILMMRKCQSKSLKNSNEVRAMHKME
jgi:hypothetical protein